MNRENNDITAGATDGMLGPNPFVGLRAIDIFAAVQQIGAQAMLHPALLLDQTAALARDLTSVVTGNEPSLPQQGDKRFADPAWRDQPLYRTTLQGYQAWRSALAGFVERSALDDTSKERAQFVMSLMTDALAPTNTLAGNPAALRKFVDSGGTSLAAGLRNMLADTLNNKGMPTQVDKTAFDVGRNLGTSPRCSRVS